MADYIVLDIGGTKIAGALIRNNKIIKKIKLPTEAKSSPQRIIGNTKQTINQLHHSKIKGIGVGIAGQVDQRRGILVSSPNFTKQFKNIGLKKILETEFKKPTIIENDANCFALGEALFGGGKDKTNVIGLTLGTGIGGGIIINKKIYTGSQGMGGELGFMVIRPKNPIKNYRPKDSLEAYASGTAMFSIYRTLSGHTLDPYTIEKKVRQHDKAAVKTMATMSQALADGLSSIISIFNPDIIVLGGGLAELNILIKPAIKEAKNQLPYHLLKKTKIVTAKLGDDAALFGAMALLKK
ncbi:MAG: ROK family protein [Patescibacteria group bacterium]|jgi:glucokinase|nr:ROK family protein [Patescibacteria group bacterium]